MSVAPLAARGVDVGVFPGTCKIDISAQIEGCSGGIEIVVGKHDYEVKREPECIYVTPTPTYKGDSHYHKRGDYALPEEEEYDDYAPVYENNDYGNDDVKKPTYDDKKVHKPTYDDKKVHKPTYDDKKVHKPTYDDKKYGHDDKKKHGGKKHDDKKKHRGDKKKHHGDGKKHVPGKDFDCKRNPLLSINLADILDLDLFTGKDISLLTNILGLDLDVIVGGSLGKTVGGLVEDLGSTLGNLLGGLLGGGRDRDSDAKKRVAKKAYDDLERDFDVKCGHKIDEKHYHGKTKKHTAADMEDCLRRCEGDALELTLELGEIFDCAAVSLSRGVEVDNCLFIADRKILDLDIDLLVDENSDSATLI